MCVFHERFSVCVSPSFPLGFEGGMWDLIVFVPDFCLYFYFDRFTQVSDLGPRSPLVMFA